MGRAFQSQQIKKGWQLDDLPQHSTSNLRAQIKLLFKGPRTSVLGGIAHFDFQGENTVSAMISFFLKLIKLFALFVLDLILSLSKLPIIAHRKASIAPIPTAQFKRPFARSLFIAQYLAIY